MGLANIHQLEYYDTHVLRLRIEAFKYKVAMAREERGGNECGIFWDGWRIFTYIIKLEYDATNTPDVTWMRPT